MAAWFAERSYRRVIVDAGPGNPFRGFYLRFGALPMDGHWLHWPDIATASGEPA